MLASEDSSAASEISSIPGCSGVKAVEPHQKLHLILPILKKSPVQKGGRLRLHSVMVVEAVVVVVEAVVVVVVVDRVVEGVNIKTMMTCLLGTFEDNAHIHVPQNNAS